VSARDNIFTKRGITPPWRPGGHVARAQGFTRYEGPDWRARRADLAKLPDGWVFESDSSPDPRKSNRSWTRWLVGALAVDGWAMPRHSIMPDHEDSEFRFAPTTQIRPDVPVFGRFDPPHSHRQLPGERRGLEQVAPRTAHAAKVCDLDADGNVLPTGHLHPHTGEVVVSPEGWHAHWRQAKYLYTPGNSARRLGTNPLSVESGYEADELFVVVMEGTLKMVAVTEAGFPAIDAGSVTLWKSESVWAEPDGDGGFDGGEYLELDEFAERHLQGRPVAVVCDSDWHANRLVRDQTEKVTEILKARGARAVACAPPAGKKLGWRHPYTGAEMRAKLGVDDWLGKHPRNRHDAFLDLVFHEKVADAEITADHPALAGIRRDGRENMVAFLRALGETAAPDTRVAPYAEGRLRATTGLAKETLQRGRRTAATRQLLQELTEADRRFDGEGGFYMEAPLVRLAPEAMPTYRVGTLRDWL
jgi:hypothetical protein